MDILLPVYNRPKLARIEQTVHSVGVALRKSSSSEAGNVTLLGSADNLKVARFGKTKRSRYGATCTNKEKTLRFTAPPKKGKLTSSKPPSAARISGVWKSWNGPETASENL